MSRDLGRIVAVVLLIVQSAIAMAAGPVICIPIKECGKHEPTPERACGGCGHDERADDCEARKQAWHHGDEHCPCSTIVHPHHDCDCHVHVPVRGDERVPTNPRGEVHDIRIFLTSIVAVTLVDWGVEARPVGDSRFEVLDFSSRDQVRALRATKLLI